MTDRFQLQLDRGRDSVLNMCKWIAEARPMLEASASFNGILDQRTRTLLALEKHMALLGLAACIINGTISSMSKDYQFSPEEYRMVQESRDLITKTFAEMSTSLQDAARFVQAAPIPNCPPQAAPPGGR